MGMDVNSWGFWGCHLECFFFWLLANLGVSLREPLHTGLKGSFCPDGLLVGFGFVYASKA